MSREKTEGSKILEEALKESCKTYCERYPRYEGELDTGEDGERPILNPSRARPRKYGNRVAARTSVIAATLILFFACSMAALWTNLIFHGTPSDPPTPTNTPIPTESTRETISTETATSGTFMNTTERTHGITASNTKETTGKTSGTATDTTVDTTADTIVKPGIVPAEIASTVFFEAADDGLLFWITVYGYRESDQDGRFYVKNNEYIIVDVQISNLSDVPVYQWLPSSCRDSALPHNHEIQADLVCGAHRLNTSVAGLPCSGMLEKWILEPGETYECRIRLAAGDPCYQGTPDLPGDGPNGWPGIKLYGEEIYTDGFCTFSGNLSFAYARSEDETANSLLLSAPMSIDVRYVSSKPDA